MATRWAIQVLTPDYLVEGVYDESKNSGTISYLFRAWADNDGKLAPYTFMHLTDARFQPTRNLTTPAGLATDWFVFPSAFVAVIPRDEPGTTYVAKNNDFKNLFHADIHMGPYIIHGTILSPNKDLSVFRYYLNFAVRDAEIECPLPDTQLQGLKAPFAMVHTHMVQGIAVHV